MIYDDLTYAYVAGLFDGEGSVIQDKQYKEPHHLYWKAQIANSDLSLINWLKETFGGHVSTDSKREPNRTMYYWRLGSLQTKGFLWMIEPYLKIPAKKEKVKEALKP